MKKPFQIFKDIYQVGGSEISGLSDCSIYLIDASSELVLIDSGAGETFDNIVDNIKDTGFNPEKLDTIIATHAHIDHIGSLNEFKDTLNVGVIAHELDADKIENGKNTGAELYGVDYEPCEVDVKLSGGKGTLRLGKHEIKFLHIPGHTPGSIACYLDIKDKRILFGQDIHGPYNLPGSDSSKVESYLKKLLYLEADILCEGHFGIYQPKGEVERYIQRYVGS